MSPRAARTGLKAALASAAAVALLSTGAAFAASGHAPWARTPVSAPAASTGHTQPTHPVPSHSESTDDPADGGSTGAGPDAHAMWGLCHAYLAGSKADHGQAWQSPAFTALALAAGGADQVATYCATVPKPGSGNTASDDPSEAGDPSHPVHPTHPAQPTHPTHPAKPSQAASPTHPAHPSHPAKPTHTPSHPAPPSHPTAPSSHSSAHSRP